MIIKIIVRLMVSALLLLSINILLTYLPAVKLIGFVCFVYFAYDSFHKNQGVMALFCCACIVYLNPFFEIHFINSAWRIVAIIITALLLTAVISDIAQVIKHSSKSEAD